MTVSGYVKRIDEYERAIVMTNGVKIPIDDIRNIDRIVRAREKFFKKFFSRLIFL